MFVRKLFFTLSLSLSLSPLFSQSLEKSFDYLNAGNYSEAYSAFREILLKEPTNPAAEFGLGKLFFMNDNPHYNLDSAFFYARKSQTDSGGDWSKSDQKKFLAVGYRAFTVTELINHINDAAYQVSDSIDDVETWNHFIATFLNSPKISEAIERRNTLAFTEVMKKNDYQSFDEFLKNYPDAKQVTDAKALYEKFLYKQKTADSTWQEYLAFTEQHASSPYFSEAKSNYERLLFLDKTKSHQLQDYILFTHTYPDNPMVTVAEDSIYSISTRSKTLSSYKDFISFHSNNHNVRNAWEHVYEKETAVFNYEAIRTFALKYSDYPDGNELQTDMQLAKKLFVRFQNDSLFGYIDSSSNEILFQPQFIEASPFSEGCAAVSANCKNENCTYAYINVRGKFISSKSFCEANDFHNGLALVSTGDCENDETKFGFINRFGEWAIQPVYDDAFEFAEGFALVRKENSGYGFINEKGEEIIPLQFKDAANFNEGVATAEVNDSAALYGYLDKTGKWAIPPKFSNAGSFSESLAPAANEKKLWGYIDHTGNWVITPKYDFAQPFENGKATVITKVKDPKNKNLFINKEKVIDKTGKLQ